ncbi:hypothetical protein I545_5794 [Mycobacterium kansasii 662]|uniref:Uncharacterized protein n=1 Tax=Mycobacterium kansasii 662 TaxID=1299326 RepID=X7YTB6_MYCKA|nr:hypothetical protein I545_5794 [Mycobacterium kansasii 662]KEP39238.1 hypothetical protein MKSMC1_56600 [Mycobacterium kansasii]
MYVGRSRYHPDMTPISPGTRAQEHVDDEIVVLVRVNTLAVSPASVSAHDPTDVRRQPASRYYPDGRTLLDVS